MKLTLEQHEFDVIREIMAERLCKLRETIEKNGNKLDAYERDIILNGPSFLGGN